MTIEDLLIAAKTVWGEARGEDYPGMLAVAWVIKNRSYDPVAAGDSSIAAVCLRHLQFSCWNKNDPNRAMMLRISPNDPDFRDCMRAVLEAFSTNKDPTEGSRWYHARTVIAPWAKDADPATTIGNHVFYNKLAL